MWNYAVLCEDSCIWELDDGAGASPVQLDEESCGVFIDVSVPSETRHLLILVGDLEDDELTPYYRGEVASDCLYGTHDPTEVVVEGSKLRGADGRNPYIKMESTSELSVLVVAYDKIPKEGPWHWTRFPEKALKTWLEAPPVQGKDDPLATHCVRLEVEP